VIGHHNEGGQENLVPELAGSLPSLHDNLAVAIQVHPPAFDGAEERSTILRVCRDEIRASPSVSADAMRRGFDTGSFVKYATGDLSELRCLALRDRAEEGGLGVANGLVSCELKTLGHRGVEAPYTTDHDLRAYKGSMGVLLVCFGGRRFTWNVLRFVPGVRLPRWRRSPSLPAAAAP
jgi:hypothetical protein